jgi:hypothetical protein
VSVGMERDTAGPESDHDQPPRPGRRWKLALLGLVAVFAVLACYDLITLPGGAGGTGAASRSGPAVASSTPAGAVSSAAPPAKAVLSPSPAARMLPVASITAFGPRGTADGDNASIVSRVNEAGAQPWYSSWYATPEFGNLQSGTGLLLDLGTAVHVSDVRVVLGSERGAAVQVRAGNSPVLADMATVASAADVAGTVRLAATAPATGRYVLIWFTRLPPNGQRGQYQVDVYGVTVDGTASAAA